MTTPRDHEPERALDGRLILALSMFGLAMGVATVFVISSKVEPVVWLAIFVVCAYVIATRAPGRPFLHGFLVSLVNSVWVTGAHMALMPSYLARHPNEAAMLARMPMPDSPRLMMLLTGPIVGIVSGIVLGLFSLAASKLVRSPD
ncbi:MAG: hypothetical protein ACXWLL_06860 [Myxococcaceae bacterium]